MQSLWDSVDGWAVEGQRWHYGEGSDIAVEMKQGGSVKKVVLLGGSEGVSHRVMLQGKERGIVLDSAFDCLMTFWAR